MSMDWENYGRERYGYRENREVPYTSYRSRQSNPYSHAARSYNDYVEGNTVRKVRPLPERRRREEVRPERERKHYPERKPVKMPGISRRGFVFLAGMLAAVVLSGFVYLSMQSTVAKQKSEIVSLQSEIAEIKEQNDEMYQNIVNSVNLADIYKIATEKLKMVHAGKNRVYTYSNKKSDMVKQYANIPGVND